MRLCSSFLGTLLLAAFTLPLAAQQVPIPVPAEKQPSLTVDTDPVPSPDAAVPAPPMQKEQQGGAAVQRGAGGGYTIRRDVEEVVLNATVLDQNGRLVNTLTKDDFKVYEDNVLQTIAAFQHSDLPVSMGILVDNSGSMHDKRGAVNAAALDLVRASNPEDEAFIVNFSDEAFIDQEFTSNISKLQDGLSHIDAKGGTALYDAVVASADELSKGAKQPKQVLLVITDGEDNASSLTLEQTIRRIQDLQGPVVYSIGLLFGSDSSRESHRAQRALQLLSDETGGIAFFPKNLGQVDAIANEVARDIRSQYTIGYHSTKPASLGGYRVVRVEAHAPHMKLIVRTRSGYYPRSAGSKTAQGSGITLQSGQQ
ncbi:VWFA-related protein [Acidipila rosea]|uniref:VWFA-related protein n=1 Tax=Acidipila rosea TaxID=768535 RepID=A0A4R1L533_9BACT|nr:VWFA-related protein [Acidipila rosea]